jgi:metal transporter CNNM
MAIIPRYQRSSRGEAAIRPVVLGLARIASVGIASVGAAPLSAGEHERHGDVDDGDIWILYVASMVLVLLGGAFAGLTIAYVHLLSHDRRNVHLD